MLSSPFFPKFHVRDFFSIYILFYGLIFVSIFPGRFFLGKTSLKEVFSSISIRESNLDFDLLLLRFGKTGGSRA